MSNKPQKGETAPIKTVAAIDVGSSGIRMEIAELRPAEKRVRGIESFHKSVLLGNDTFDTGRLSVGALKATCEALINFKKSMTDFRVRESRAVATSAVREAENCDIFVDQVRNATGIDLKVLDGAEQSRLTYSGVRASLANEIDFRNECVAIAEVGGGGADVILVDKEECIYADNFALGSIRIRQSIRHARLDFQERNRVMRRMVRAATFHIPQSIPLDRARTLVALGSDVRFLAQQVLPDEPAASKHWTLSKDRFLAGCRMIADEDPARLSDKYTLSFSDLATLGPALMIYERIAEATNADRVIVSKANIRDGILLDMLEAALGTEDTFDQQIVASAVGLARKYQVDEMHAMHVARLALELFDATASLHNMEERDRFLLRVAAILHEIGAFVHNRSHHKHTLYLISSSEVFGLSEKDIAIVANIARYHRRSPPRKTHDSYVSLDREDRLKVLKLAALLRVVDALDKEHTQRISSPHFRIEREQLEILVPGKDETWVESAFLEEKGDLFHEIYGLKPVIIPSSE